jgi:DNA-binding CsgD family transcriptional regulator
VSVAAICLFEDLEAMSGERLGEAERSLREPVKRILQDLVRSTGAVAAGFLALERGLGGAVQVGRRSFAGSLPPELTAWLMDAATLGDLGWTAVDLVPVGRLCVRQLPIPEGSWRVAGGLVADGTRVLGWLAVAPRDDSTGGLEAAWTTAHDRILAQRDHEPSGRREPAALTLDSQGEVERACHEAEGWLRLPHFRVFITGRALAFLESGEDRLRLNTGLGEMELLRLRGEHGDQVLLRVSAGRPLGIPVPAELTPRQLDVAAYAVAGATVTEIASALRVGPETIRTHLKDTYRRLHVGNRLELARLLQPTWPVW